MVTDLSYFHIYVGCRVEDLGGQFQDSLLIYLERLDHETFFFYIISNIVLLNIEWNQKFLIKYYSSIVILKCSRMSIYRFGNIMSRPVYC